MTTKWKNLSAIAALRVSSTALTADTDGTELVDARLDSFKSGLFICVVGATDVASADETYDLILEGKQTSGGTFVELAKIALTFAVDPSNKIHVASVDRFRKRMRFRLDVGGTTPSIVVHAFAQALDFTYQPDVGTIITA